MSELFAFRCSTPEFRVPESVLVIFCGPQPFSQLDISDAVTAATKVGPPPEMLLVLAPTDQASSITRMPSDHTAWAPLSRANTAIHVLSYDRVGQFTPHGWSVRPEEKLALTAAIRRQGLTQLFKDRGGMLEAGPTAHFVKPSLSLDTRFLRAANALSGGLELFFAALWLLPHLGDDVEVVHMDTSAVASLVLAAQLLKGPQAAATLPDLRTFRSYDGLRTHSFSNLRRELALISASQSGRMAGEIAPKLSRPSDVITLFSLSEPAPNTTVLCDLRHDDRANIRGFEASVAQPTGLSTRPIRIIGEHFIAEPRPARMVLPTTKNAPPVLNQLGRLAGVRAFSVLKTQPSEGPKAAWVDVPRLLQSPEAEGWISEKLLPELPLTTKALVRIDETNDTKALVEAIKAEAQRQAGRAPVWRELSLADVESRPGADTEIGRGAVLVVGGAVGHGRELLSASRALRVFAPDSRRVYITAAVIGADEQINRVLSNNLGYGGHKVYCLLSLAFDRRAGVGSWDLELQALEKFDDELPEPLKARLARLQATAQGLTDDVFLTDGSALPLRENFAFWDQVPGERSQADVFVTIAALLEHLRSGRKTEAEERLLNDAQTHSVLSPEVFSRFNDGVIQAAFLRAARPVELNYVGSPDASRAMADMITRMADLHDRPQGEALAEFLLALWTERLVLEPRHAARLRAELVRRADSLPAIATWLAQMPT